MRTHGKLVFSTHMQSPTRMSRVLMRSISVQRLCDVTGGRKHTLTAMPKLEARRRYQVELLP
ncbi:hypothetical protein VFPPC_16691 [Pochonia chlamydosporia 170]|uniref:Uncharacterized protein n=1 Tax=Pochonia chlamydosporia 170 TaxID=1380566 RepID=A0A179F6T9_METCM|nr:hypothetical protein VFPPC_16691 [Pochonia chlamydosporia 170]OAQ61020.1 hypothetical protein VFPPC_16691 [Pochonia chlamydosporia 170]